MLASPTCSAGSPIQPGGSRSRPARRHLQASLPAQAAQQLLTACPRPAPGSRSTPGEPGGRASQRMQHVACHSAAALPALRRRRGSAAGSNKHAMCAGLCRTRLNRRSRHAWTAPWAHDMFGAARPSPAPTANGHAVLPAAPAGLRPVRPAEASSSGEPGPNSPVQPQGLPPSWQPQHAGRLAEAGRPDRLHQAGSANRAPTGSRPARPPADSADRQPAGPAGRQPSPSPSQPSQGSTGTRWRQRTADVPPQDGPVGNGHAPPGGASSSRQQQQPPEGHWSAQMAFLPGADARQAGGAAPSWADVTD